MVTVSLPQPNILLGRLRRRSRDSHINDNLFPAIVEYIYAGGSKKSGEQIGAALIDAIKCYLGRLDGSARSLRMGLVSGSLELYLETISFDFEGEEGQRVLDDALAYCTVHWREIAE